MTKRQIIRMVPENLRDQVTVHREGRQVAAITWDGDGTLIATRRDGVLEPSETGLDRLRRIS